MTNQECCSPYCGSWYYTKSILIFTLMALFLCFEMALQVSPGVIAKHLINDLQLSPLSLGIMSGCYFITYAVMQIPSGLMYDRANFRILVTCAILACSLGTLLFGSITSMWLGILARLLMGFGSAFAFLSVLTVAARYFPSKYFALLTGCAQLLAAVGGMAGNLPIAWAVHQIGWRHTLYALAIIGFALAACVWLFIRKPKHPPQQNEALSEPVTASLKVISHNRQTWFVGLYAFFNWAPVTAFASLWGVPYLQTAYQFSITQASFFIALIWLGIGITSPAVGALSDSLGRRKPLLLTAALIGLLSISAVLFSAPLPLWLLGVLLLLTGVGSAGQILSFAVVKDITPVPRTSTAIGFNNMAVVASGFLVQPLIGHLLQSHSHIQHITLSTHFSLSDFHSALLLLPLCFLACILLTVFFIRETYCGPVES